RMLIGEFSSKEQSLQDTTYLNIHLSMSRIWEEDKSAIWLYVEQAMDAKREKPYRQRVYKLNHPGKDIFTSDIYTLKNQERFIGLQNDATKRNALTPDMIELKEGCTVSMKAMNGFYIGGTDADNCPSDLRGASYATTKIILKENILESWDQGFDKNGIQVWGATKGGYIFVREQ
ncbi:MAG: chromophore lyase CpcT/CpeT, partial [Ignavibacteria bacterium]